MPTDADLAELDLQCVTLRAPAMGGEFAIQFPATQPDRDAAVRAFETIAQLEQQLSIYREDSELTALNRTAAAGPVRVAANSFALLERCVRWHRETDGAFDVSAGPLVRVWGFVERANEVPSDEAVADALARVGMDKVALDRERRTVAFATAGMEIDFGGVGKGYALDRTARWLKAHGFRRTLLGASGSSTLAVGAPTWDDCWTVDVRHPLDRNRPIALLQLSDAALSTSAASERWFAADGKRYGHVLDPRTGRPVDRLLQATAYAPDAAHAEALSTAFFVNGAEWTEAYCRAHPEIGALLVGKPNADGDAPLEIMGALHGRVVLPEPPA